MRIITNHGNTRQQPPGRNEAVSLRRNGSGSVFTRRILNLIEGVNTSITLADDAVNSEIDVTVTSSGGSGGGTLFILPDGENFQVQNEALDQILFIDDGRVQTFGELFCTPVDPAQIPFQVTGALLQTGNLAEFKTDGMGLEIDFAGRVIAENDPSTIAAGDGAGTGPTVAISGSDMAGIVSVTSGTAPSNSATVVTITFSAAYAAAPRAVILTPANENAVTLSGVTAVRVDSADTTASLWKITAGMTGLAGATVYKWHYLVIG